jgi:predicted permease
MVPAGVGEGVIYGLRSIKRSPGYAAAVVLLLTVSLGANTAVFSVAQAVLLRTLPYESPEQVVAIEPPPLAMSPNGFALDQDFLEMVEAGGLYFDNGETNLSRDGAAQHISLAQVTGDFFRTLGVQPLLGPGFSADPDDPMVAVLTHHLWVQAFGADGNVVGKDIQLNGLTYRVAGVMPADAVFPAGVDLWLPFSEVMDFYGSAFGPQAIARIRPDTDLTALQEILQSRLRDSYLASGIPEEHVPPLRLRSLREELTSPVRTSVLVLMGIAGLVTLLGCLNLAGLALSRTAGRAEEMSVRRALGAGRPRLFSQLLTEVLVLSLVAGAASLLATVWTSKLVVAVLPGEVQGIDEVGLGASVLLFATALTVGAGLLVGAFPALQGAFSGKEGPSDGRSASDTPGLVRVQGGLVVGQVALAFILVAGAGLLGTSLARLKSVPLGYDLQQTMTFNVRLPAETYPTQEAQGAYAQQLTRALKGIPGVTAVGTTTYLPLTDSWGAGSSVRRLDASEEEAQAVLWIRFTPEYLDAMQIQLLEGRPFQVPGTDPQGMDRVVLSRSASRAFFGDGPAVGETLLRRNFRGEWRETVVEAVVADVFIRGPASQAPLLLFTNMELFPAKAIGVAVRTSVPPGSLGNRLREAVISLDPSVPPFGMETTGAAAAQHLAARRAVALLGSLFSLFALLVSALGIGALVSQAVLRRRKEMGIRVALGAQANALVGSTLRMPLTLVSLGLLFGMTATLLSTTLLEGLLFEIAPRNPVAILAVGLTVSLVTILASWIPARRIARLDPAEALRLE